MAVFRARWHQTQAPGRHCMDPNGPPLGTGMAPPKRLASVDRRSSTTAFPADLLRLAGKL